MRASEGNTSVLREHVLIKVNAKDSTSIMQMCQIFRANVVDVSRAAFDA